MITVGLCCKAAVAVLLLAAGGAKLADLTGFGATVGLFMPAALRRRGPSTGGGPAPGLLRGGAAAIAAGEIALGAASLSSPLLGWLNVAVLATAGCFLAVGVIGYLRYPGRPCRCFGALSRRSFGPAGIGRAALIAAAAAVAVLPVRPSLLGLAAADRIGLAAGGLLVAAACAVAAGAMSGAGPARPAGGARWAR